METRQFIPLSSEVKFYAQTSCSASAIVRLLEEGTRRIPLYLFLRLYSGNNLDELICTVPMSESGLVNELARREYIRCNIMEII